MAARSATPELSSACTRWRCPRPMPRSAIPPTRIRICRRSAAMPRRGRPGKRMFQYRDNSGNVRAVSTTQVNAFLREIAGIKISLKDFRTLMASAVVLESLSRMSPAASARGRRKQVLEAVRAAADELSNTPAICRKSYVHDTIVTAFEDGILERFAATMKGYRSQSKREQLLAEVVMAAAAA